MHKTSHGFRAAICLCAIAASSTAQVDVSSTLQHEGLTRSYIVRLPPGFSPDQRLPLVVALHPSFSSGADFKATSGWDAVSDLHGCVVAYPTGGNPVGTNGKYAWNSWDFSGAVPNDVSFLSALVARIQQDHGTDPCRTTMTGFSNGAMMTNSFASVHPDKLAAIAPVSGGWITAYGGSETQLSPALPVAAWIWRGSNETFVTGVGANARPRDQQDQEQLAFWTSHDHALFASTQSEDLTYGLTRTYITNRYVGNAPVWFTQVQGTGHLYQPGAAELIWTRFFAPATAPTPACDPCGNFTSEICDGLDNDCDGVIDEGFIASYCTAGTTVAGCVPAIRGEGAPSSQAASGFDIVVDNVPTQKMGLIFYGLNAIPQPQPWALGSTSYLCIYYPVNRTGAHSSGGSVGACDGELRVDWNAWRAANPNTLGSPFTAGQVFHAQGWFRDSGAAKGTNLSDGLVFTLCQ